MRLTHRIFGAVFMLVFFAFGISLNANAQTWRPPHPVPEVTANQLPFQCRPQAQYAARSILCNGQPVIVYDPILTRQYEPEMLLFLRAHEYGHIELGHISSPPRFPSEELQRERAADCWAAKQLSQSDPALLDRIANLMETKYANALGNLTHDTGRGIAATIRNCRRDGEIKPPPVSGDLSQALSKFIEAGRGGFRSIKGSYLSQVGRDRKYTSLIKLPGATECVIWSDDDDETSVSCLMGAIDRYRDAETKYYELVDAFKKALPSGWSSREGNTSSITFKSTIFRGASSDPRIYIDLDRNDELRSANNRLRVRFRKPLGR